MRLMVLVSFLVACTKPNPAATCPEGFCIDSEFGFCDVDGAISGMPGTCIAVACTPGEFETCREDQAITCNATGDDFELSLCPFGCGTSGCLACGAGETSCVSGDLYSCGEGGIPAFVESCRAGCVDDERPHCAYLEPKYAPDICDVPATQPELVFSSSGGLDPNLDTTCTGGVIEQPGTTSLCVVHYGTIRVEPGVVVSILGKPKKQGRVIMFVADHDLSIEGTIDASARGPTNGPGGGVLNSGGGYGVDRGGGGAGGASMGGAGATDTLPSNNGGLLAVNPATLQSLVGGASPPQVFDSSMNRDTSGGGGGGGVALASCRGKLSVSGVVAVNGGGGDGGDDFLLKHGFGGGAGGNVVLQALEVEVTGKLFSNGGGGGSGRRASGTFGVNGRDGRLDLTAASGGATTAADGAGSGGSGGVGSVAPTGGLKFVINQAGNGGGGGSVGFLQVYTPANIDPTLEPMQVSPNFQPNAVVGVR